MRTREEQIASLAAAIYMGAAKMPHALKEAETYILEAERRAEQRVRSEIGRDSERLDWLSEDRRSLASHASIGSFVTTESGETCVHEDIRVAIDAAREMG